MRARRECAALGRVIGRVEDPGERGRFSSEGTGFGVVFDGFAEVFQPEERFVGFRVHTPDSCREFGVGASEPGRPIVGGDGFRSPDELGCRVSMSRLSEQRTRIGASASREFGRSSPQLFMGHDRGCCRNWAMSVPHRWPTNIAESAMRAVGPMI